MCDKRRLCLGILNPTLFSVLATGFAAIELNRFIFFGEVATFLDDDGKLPKSVMPDLLHPNEKGYQMWAAAQEPMIKKLLAE